MPSGVSAATTVSRASVATRGRSGLDDDRVCDLGVETLPRFAEDEERVQQGVERHDADEPVHDIAQPEKSAERYRWTVGADNLDAEEPLGDCLSVPLHVSDR